MNPKLSKEQLDAGTSITYWSVKADKYRVEAEQLTEERDDAIAALREAVVLIERSDDFSDPTKDFLFRTYTKFPFLCICHGGSVCNDACLTRHHGGCGIERRGV